MSEKSRPDHQSRAERRQAMVKNRRGDRMKAYQRNKREMLIIKSVSIGLGVVILAGIAYYAVDAIKNRNLNNPPDGVIEYAYTSSHVEGDIDYSAQEGYQGEIPPAGGVHNDTAQQCDVYAQPIRQESAIHSLEHGAVWITYEPTLAEDQVGSLKAMVQGDDYVMMSPYPGSPAPIVLTAWNRQLQMQSFDKDTVEKFMRAFKNKPGITPEFGASCSGTTMTVAATP